MFEYGEIVGGQKATANGNMIVFTLGALQKLFV